MALRLNMIFHTWNCTLVTIVTRLFEKFAVRLNKLEPQLLVVNHVAGLCLHTPLH